MRKKIALTAVILLILVVTWQVASARRQDNLDPLKVAGDTHKLVFENTFVRVLEVHVPPGKTEPMHSHGRRVVVYLSDFHTRTTERGKPPVENLRKSGFVRWSDPVVHTIENIGKTEGHVISVELK
jgi:hypothetical protein